MCFLDLLRKAMEWVMNEWMNESNANNHSRLRLGLNTISSMMRKITPPPLFGDKTGNKQLDYYYYNQRLL